MTNVLISALALADFSSGQITSTVTAMAFNSTTEIVCDPGVQIIGARGTNEAPGPTGMGGIGSLAEQIDAALSGSSTQGINYPARVLVYEISKNKGTTDFKDQIESYVHNCPKARIILLGFSQVLRLLLTRSIAPFIDFLYERAPKL